MSNYDNYDLFKDMDKFLTRERFKAPRSKSFYPSEASVVATDKHGDRVVHGKCLRAAYFRLSDKFEAAPHSAHTQYIFMGGNRVEAQLVQVWKEMGVWVDNSVKFVDHENNISGELDAILREPDTGIEYFIEAKSFYGYFAEKEIFGNKSQKGFPKIGQLLQTLIYLNFFKDKFSYGRMVYFDRGGSKRRTFKIELHEEDGVTYPVVEGEVIRSFTIEGIYDRYNQLKKHIEDGIVPQGDFELQFSNEKIQDHYSKGKVAKTKYDKWQRGKLGLNEYVGDWECSYCNHKDTCWKTSSELVQLPTNKTI